MLHYAYIASLVVFYFSIHLCLLSEKLMDPIL